MKLNSPPRTGVLLAGLVTVLGLLASGEAVSAAAPSKTASFVISLNASPGNAGSVIGDGMFAGGSRRTVTATANSGYVFTGWTESGRMVSTVPNYTFTLSGARSLTATFSPANRPASASSPATDMRTAGTTPAVLPPKSVGYAISLSVSPSAGGRVSGEGSFPSGSRRTVVANPASGYSFGGWMENGRAISSSQSYSFTLTGSRSLVAIFLPTKAELPSSSATKSVVRQSNPTASGPGQAENRFDPKKHAGALFEILDEIATRHRTVLKLESYADSKFGGLRLGEYRLSPSSSIDARGVANGVRTLQAAGKVATLYSVYTNAKTEFESRGIGGSSLVDAWVSAPQSVIFAFQNPDAGLKALTEGFTSATAVSIRMGSFGLIEVSGPEVEKFVNKVSRRGR